MVTRSFTDFSKAKKFVRRAGRLDYVTFINNPYAFQSSYEVRIVGRSVTV